MFSCFGKTGNARDRAFVGADRHDDAPRAAAGTAPPSCIFCDIPPADVPSSFRIVLESDDFVAFHDRTPRAAQHLLTVPRRHIGNVRDLRGKAGADLVERMQAFGAQALDIVGEKANPDNLSGVLTGERTLVDAPATGDARRFGFHIAPFNSVDHLHLHCFQEPMTFIGRLKYPIAGPSPNARPPLIKGWSWFVTADQTIALLRANRRVRVGAQSGYSTVGSHGPRDIGGVPAARHDRGDFVSGTLSS
ncbi:unnamed protein product [Parajaminaea phylloscopi]